MIEDIFFKKIKTNFTKTGFKLEKWAEIICDECGTCKVSRYKTVMRGRKRRKADVDLCIKCSYLSKYKFSIFSKTMKQAVNWKGGESKIGGYVRVYIGNGKRIFKHVQIYENHIGRKLIKEERLHHIDLDKMNNKIDNLYLCKNNRDHILCHILSQDVAKSLLNKKIWFDRKNKIYTTKYINDSKDKIKKIDFPLKYEISIRVIKHKTKRRIFKYKIFYLENGERKYVHTYIAENIIGRKLYAYECVHHIDMNTLNNNFNNLIVLTRKAHRLAHISLQSCVADLYKKDIVKFKKGEYYV